MEYRIRLRAHRRADASFAAATTKGKGGVLPPVIGMTLAPPARVGVGLGCAAFFDIFLGFGFFPVSTANPRSHPTPLTQADSWLHYMVCENIPRVVIFLKKCILKISSRRKGTIFSPIH
jgi:hypothetical protein